MKIIELDEADSTNKYIKRLVSDEDVIVTAKRQTDGRGTKGRSFISDEGGLYLSYKRFLGNFPPENTFKIMVNACVAVCAALEEFNIKPEIKWANDVLVGGKKISGTLIENSFTSGGLVSVIGIGVNVNNPVPAGLENVATSVCLNTSRKVTVNEVKDALIKNLQKEYTIDDYRSRIGFFGRKITVVDDGERSATALDVSDDGRLKIMEEDGAVRFLSAAEVSLKS